MRVGRSWDSYGWIMGETPTDPGWYDDPAGKKAYQAYWDGEGWTGETRWPPATTSPGLRARWLRLPLPAQFLIAGIGLLVVGFFDLFGALYASEYSDETSANVLAVAALVIGGLGAVSVTVGTVLGLMKLIRRNRRQDSGS